MKNLISHHNMNLKKGTLLFLLLTCLAYTTLAQTDHTLQYEDITIDGNGIITACTYDFEANEDAGGTKLIIPKSVTKPIDGGGVETIIIKGIANESPGVFQNKNLVSLTFVDSEVETIGSFAFCNNSITELSLPASLTTIGSGAFYNNKITTLSLPPSLETIGKWAFYNNQITTLTIPNNSQLMTIGDNAFRGNDGDAAGGNKIKELSLPPSLETIGGEAFSNNSLTTVTFNVDLSKSKILEIGSYAFWNNSITELSLPASLTTIGSGAFYNNKITTLTIPNNSQLMTIGDNAFKGNDGDAAGGNKIKELSLPPSLETIGKWAFSNNSLTTVTFNVDLSKSKILEIGSYAFWNNSITELSLPPSLETIGKWAFYNNQITTLTIPNNSQLMTIGDNAFQGNDGDAAGGNKIKELSLPPSLETIGKWAFYNNSLTTVTFNVDLSKSKIREIGSSAFSGNTGLTGITLPKHAGGDDVTYKDSNNQEYDPNDEDNNSFTHFDRSLVTVLPYYELTSNDVTVDEQGIITGCTCNFISNRIIIPVQIPTRIETTTIIYTIHGIGSKAFFGKNLVAVTFQKGSQVTYIGHAAFSYNQITTLSLPPTLTTIGLGAFFHNQITTLSLPPSLTTIGSGAFQDNQITTLTLPPSLTTIRSSAFSHNEITTLTIPNDSKLKTIGYNAFQGNEDKYAGGNKIKELSLPPSLETIERRAFLYNSLTTVTFNVDLNKSKIREIGSGAFSGNTGLTGITLPEHAEETNVTYKDSEDDIYSSEETFSHFDRRLVTVFPYYTLKEGDVKVVGGIITECYCNFGSNRIIIPVQIGTETITGIKSFAFKSKNLAAVIFAKSSKVISIGYNAFEGNIIETLVLPTVLTTIEHKAFLNNKITELSLPPSLTTIEYNAFLNNKITELSLPPSLTTIGDNAFYNNEITELSLPPSLTTIGKKAFYNNSLISVTFNDDPEKSQIREIGSCAFSGNNVLTGIKLPKHAEGTGVTYIDSRYQKYDPEKSEHMSLFDIALVMVLPPHKLTSSDVTVDEQGIITGCNCENFVSNSIIIPVQIGTKTITGIGDNVFQSKNLASVTFETGSKVISIGESAFSDGKGDFYDNLLYSFTLPMTVIDGVRTYWKDSNEKNKEGELTIFQVDFVKSFELVSIQQVTLTLTIKETEASGEVRGLSAGDNKIDKGADFKLQAMPASGQRFASWTIGGKIIENNPYTLTTTETDISITVTFEAIPLDEQVTLTLDIVGEGSTTPDEADTIYEKGKNVKLTATPDEGWRFDRWVMIEQEDILTNTHTITLQDNIQATAHFIKQVTLTLAALGKGGITRSVRSNVGMYDINTEVKFTASPADGWRFDKWVIGGEDENDNPTIVKFDVDKTVTAHFVQLVTLTTAVEGEQRGTITRSVEPNDKGVYDINTEVTLTAEPKQGWKFDKWVIEGEDENDNPITVTVDAVRTATAHFVEAVTLTLTIVETEASGEVSGLSAGENKIDKGADFKLEAIPVSGQRFASWTIGGQTIVDNPYTLTATQADISITVTFEAIPLGEQVTLTLAIVGEGSTTPDEADTIYEKGKDVDLIAEPNPGWRFDKWVIERENENDKTTTITLDTDKSVTAHFVELVTLTLTIEETEASGEVSGLSAGNNKIDKGADFKLQAMPASGQRFVSWNIGGKTIKNNPHTLPTTAIATDISITVTFEAIQVMLTLAIEGEGSITQSLEPNSVDPDNEMKGMYDINTEVTLTATPQDGWRFDKWVISDEENETDKVTTITMATDKSVTAHFVEIVTLTVEVNDKEGGSIEPPDGNFVIDKAEAPSTQELTAKPNDGWRFDKWIITSGEDGNGNPITKTVHVVGVEVTVDADKTATAYFVKLVTLTTSVEGQQGGTISATPNHSLEDNQYDINTDVKLTATPNEGWRFDKWVISDEQDKTDETTTITLDADKTATAHFVQQFTLTTAVAGQQGGTIAPLIDPNGKVYDIKTEVTLTANPQDRWRFDKWVITSGEDGNGNPITETVDHVDHVVTVDADKTATAYFVEQVTLTLTISGGGLVDGFKAGGNTVDKGQSLTLTADPQDGWRFDKWVISDEENKNDKTTITMDTDKTATAHFVEIVTLTVEVNDKEGGSIEPSDDHFAIDKAAAPSTQELTATPNEGWRFDKWVISDEEDKNDKTTITLDKNKTATAHFVQLVTLTLNIEGQQGGTISATPNPSLEDNQYDINTDVELTAKPADSWRFDKWVITGGEDENDNPITVTVDADKTAIAHFVKQVILTLTIEETEASGEVNGLSAGKNKIDKGADFELKATPVSGQRFASWNIGGQTIVDNPHTLTTTEADIGITVTFEAIPLDNQVTLTLDIVGEGSTTPDKGENIYKKDKDVELTATPNDGWRFERWIIESDEVTENPTTITLDKNKSVTAYFVEEEEAITGILTEVVSATPYPNPVTSQITLKAKDSDLIQLFSQKGEQQYSAQHTGNEVHTIDVSTLPVGVYLVRITDAEGNTTTKRILKK